MTSTHNSRRFMSSRFQRHFIETLPAKCNCFCKRTTHNSLTPKLLKTFKANLKAAKLLTTLQKKRLLITELRRYVVAELHPSC